MRTEKETLDILEKIKDDEYARACYNDFIHKNNTGDPGFPAKTVYGFYFIDCSRFFKKNTDDVNHDIIDFVKDLWYDNKINTLEEAEDAYTKELASYKATGKYSFKKHFDIQVFFHYMSDVDHGFRDPVDNIYDIFK